MHKILNRIKAKRSVNMRLVRLAWYLYDFANSSYSAVIASTLFPVFYATEIVGNEEKLGDILWGKAISLSMALCAAFSPYLGGIADFLRLRKKMLFFLTSLCVVSVGSLSFLRKGMALEGFLLIVLANFAMESAFVFYNSFLPTVEKGSGLGRTSAIGFGTGYLGSIVSLLISLFLLKEGLIQLVWPFVAFFFFVFSIPLFVLLPPDVPVKKGIVSSAKAGLTQVIEMIRRLIKNRNLKYFLLAYLFYEDGINTVIVFSSIYAATTLGLTSLEIVIVYLSIQGSAMLGAFISSGFVETLGYKKVLSFSILAWVIITLIAAVIFQKWQFALLSITGGLFLGVLQASSRALFSTFIPYGEESKYFGLYSLVGKSSAILGPFLFGLISYATGSQRIAVTFVSLLFFLAFLLMRNVNKKSG